MKKLKLSVETGQVQLADRLWHIYERAPHHYPQLAAHLSKFKVIPERHAIRLIHEIDTQELYPAIRATLIRASVGRLPESAIKLAKARFKPLWKLRLNQVDLSDSLWLWLCKEKHLTEAQMRYGFTSKIPAWLKMRLHYGMQWEDIAEKTRASWINNSLRSKHADVAVSAAWLCGIHSIEPLRPIRDINPQAKLVLKELGLVRRANSSVCGIQLAIAQMTGQEIPVQWKKFFGKSYKRAEAQITTCKGYFKTDPTAWVNAFDVFNDLVLDALYRKDPTLGGYTLGTVGSVIASTRQKADYPAIARLANQIHAKRLESELSHARVKKTKKPTGPIKFKWLKTGARLLARGAEELLYKNDH